MNMCHKIKDVVYIRVFKRKLKPKFMQYKKTMPEIQVRMMKSDVHKAKITRSEDVVAVMREVFDPEELQTYESFYVVYLNAANKTIGWIRISQGGLTGTMCDVRLVMKGAVDCLAVGIILAHNHPSGNLKPSTADIELTKKCVEAAKLFDIRVLDHLIMTEVAHYSFADEGLI